MNILVINCGSSSLKYQLIDSASEAVLAKVASTVSLEHTILDLTDFPDAKPGDEIVILGRQGEEEITLEQRMEEWGLTVPRIWTEISAHLDRHYYRDGKLWAVAKDERFILNEN